MGFIDAIVKIAFVFLIVVSAIYLNHLYFGDKPVIKNNQSYSVEPTVVDITVAPTESIIQPVQPVFISKDIINQNFNYVLRGKRGYISVMLNKDVYNNKSVDSEVQMRELDKVVDKIKLETSDSDDRARIAISMVQTIPYIDGIRNESAKKPYRVLYTNSGDCDEKTFLLEYILYKLGYDVVTFEFDKESHMALGIRSDIEYSYKNTGYAFVEATRPTIITNSYGEYSDPNNSDIGIKLTSFPTITHLSNGTLDLDVSEEFGDAILYNQIENEVDSLNPMEYRQWEILLWKYGITPDDGQSITEDPSKKPLCEGDRYCNGGCWDKCPKGGVWSCTPDGAVCTV